MSREARFRSRRRVEQDFELHRGDVLDPGSLEGAGEGADVAYYLVHAIGRGGAGDFEELERRAADNFAEMAKREGVERVVYLGGAPGSRRRCGAPSTTRRLITRRSQVAGSGACATVQRSSSTSPMMMPSGPRT